ncbi:hypothetical protein IKE98_01465 [Candidatus Saccharibacteria bacterium]|nr:hypothetical protein [Candidatus Saccharibacteria bacterium]
MKRLIVVFNPRSSRYDKVRHDVINRLNSLKGYLIGKYEVEPTDLDHNIKKLSKLLKDGDLVISAGGDATGIIASNAILMSEKDAMLSALPYGNFNDLARTLGTKSLDDILFGETRELYPLEIYIDDKFFRYSTCYTTIGMTAAAVHIYDSPKMRAKLKSDIGRKIGSYTSLAGWYFKNRHKQVFMPEFVLNGLPVARKTSDYTAVNGRFMARVMKGREDYRDSEYFRSEIDYLVSFYRLSKMMAKSIFTRIPGSLTTKDTLEFLQPSTVVIQTEGEYRTCEKICKIEIKKSKKRLKVVEH